MLRCRRRERRERAVGSDVRYDSDFVGWTFEQARLLRAGDWSALDVERIAEELEAMGRSERRALAHRLEGLLCIC